MKFFQGCCFFFFYFCAMLGGGGNKYDRSKRFMQALW